MDQNLHNNSPLIYEMDSSSEDQNQIKSDLSTSSKSNQNKKHQQETQVSEIPTDNLETTQIIKIKPSKKQNAQIDHNTLCLTSNPKPQCLIFSQSSQDKEEQNQIKEQQEQDLQSPAKLRRSKRKRHRSATKKRVAFNKEKIFDETQFSVKKQQITVMRQFSEVQKIPSYLQMQDSGRYFGTGQQNKSSIKQRRNQIQLNKRQKTRPKINKYEYERQYQQQSYQICEFQQKYQQNNENEFIYEHDEGSQQQSFQKSRGNNRNSKIKVLSNLPKSITVMTTVQTLVMNPVPKGLKICCTFVIDKKYMGLSTQYNMIINSTQKVVLSAKKEHFSFTSSKFIISINQNYITKRLDNPAFIGRLTSNFLGTEYELTKRDIKNASKNVSCSFKGQEDKNEENKQQMQNETLQAIIGFENNLWGSGGMRKMQITKLNKQKLTQRDKLKKVSFQQVYQRGQVSKLMKVQTSKPTYNKTTQRYTLNFDNKVKIPSAKNMILEYKSIQNDRRSECNDKKFQQKDNKKHQKNKQDKCLLLAKQKDNSYLVQVGYPLSLYEAFGACLANNDSKIMVN